MANFVFDYQIDLQAYRPGFAVVARPALNQIVSDSNTMPMKEDCKCKGKCSDCSKRKWRVGALVAIVLLAAYGIYRFAFKK